MSQNLQAMIDTRDKFLTRYKEERDENYSHFIAEVASILAYGDDIYSTLGMLGNSGIHATESMRELVVRCLSLQAVQAGIDLKELEEATNKARAMMKAVDAAGETSTISLLP